MPPAATLTEDGKILLPTGVGDGRSYSPSSLLRFLAGYNKLYDFTKGNGWVAVRYAPNGMTLSQLRDMSGMVPAAGPVCAPRLHRSRKDASSDDEKNSNLKRRRRRRLLHHANEGSFDNKQDLGANSDSSDADVDDSDDDGDGDGDGDEDDDGDGDGGDDNDDGGSSDDEEDEVEQAHCYGNSTWNGSSDAENTDQNTLQPRQKRKLESLGQMLPSKRSPGPNVPGSHCRSGQHGAPLGLEAGTLFRSRTKLSASGIHVPTGGDDHVVPIARRNALLQALRALLHLCAALFS